MNKLKIKVLIVFFILVLNVIIPPVANAEVSTTDWIFPNSVANSYDFLNPLDALIRDGVIAVSNSSIGYLFVNNFSPINLQNNAQINKVEIRFHLAGVRTTYRFQQNGVECVDHANPGYYKSFIPTSVSAITDSVVNYTDQDCAIDLDRIKTGNYLVSMYRYDGSSSLPYKIDDISVRFVYTIPDFTPTPTSEPTLTPTPTTIPTPTPSPTDVPTPTPTPEVLGAVAPFLDLPFDYQGLGKTFEQVALNPMSWFDHAYPLQNIPGFVMRVLKYTGEEDDVSYRSHSGYDYALNDGVSLGTDVLAAAGGEANLVLEAHSGGGGNVIKIDHGNGYQTWYEHLSKDDLIVSTENTFIHVEKGEKIGKVGMTGNTNGPHVHLSVFKDENGNGTFLDDYPFGLVDPLGWEGTTPDPWTEYGTARHGAKSSSLFIAREQSKSTGILPSGGQISTNNINVIVPDGAAVQFFTISVRNSSFEHTDVLGSIMPSFFLKAINNLGDSITQFFKPITMTYDYSDADLANVEEDSLKVYRYNEDTNLWEALPSDLDKTNKKITAQTSHFSHFALMGQVKDKVAPTTEVLLSGDKGLGDWYRSSVSLELIGKDNDGGLGLEDTLYTTNGSDWFEYSSPLIFEDEGEHVITYQSIDKAGNLEDQKTVTFHIDKTVPEAKIQYDLSRQDIVISGMDDSGITTVTEMTVKKNKKQISIVDRAGNELILKDIERDHGANGLLKILALSYNGSVIDLDADRFSVKYDEDKKGKIKTLKQVYEVKGGEKIKLEYDAQADKTTITQNKQKIKVDSMKFLNLYTENGAIEYSY